MPAIQIHLGTMTFGWGQASETVDERVAGEFVTAFTAAGHKTIDCARIYAGGKSEQMFGRVLQASGTRDALEIVTKAHPSQKDGLTPAGLRAQVEASVSALQVTKIDLLYLHQPDKTSALSDTLATVNDMLTEGVIGSFGLSNYSAVEVDRCVELCRGRGYALPVAYQGLYNAINRRVEDELFPTLRKHGIAFVAYNPLAAGLLTGKHVQEGEVKKGRFKDNPNYLGRFYKPDLFEGLSLVRSACDGAELSMVDASFRWLLHHSALADGDGIVLGASSTAQLAQNLEGVAQKDPLPDAVVAAFDEAWKIGQPDAFAFWRGYSGDQPGRDDMDQGADYVPK